MKCSDEESFKWTVTRVLNPTDVSSERVTKILKEQSKNYNWEGLDFPTPLEQIETFEKNNNLLVNVFGFDKGVEILRIPNGDRTGRILLMLVDGRYTIVKSLSRLLYGQATRRNCKRFYCENCLKGFSSVEKLDGHVTCSDEKSAAERIRQKPKDKPKCELCSKQRTVMCALHSDLKGDGSLKLVYLRKIREVTLRPGRENDVFVNYGGETYKAVLRENEWVFDCIGETKNPKVFGVDEDDKPLEVVRVSEASIMDECLLSIFENVASDTI